MNSNYSADPTKAMTSEQFSQVVEAILDGKYSWACVLILRFAGYNPLHYIPYRTYNRLVKDNCSKSSARVAQKKRSPSRDASHAIRDLSYVEAINEKSPHVVGGVCGYAYWWPHCGEAL
ncbi:MAG: HetP family heterocyst commitment protein [Elainellaceae cyanobacterium]